VDKLGIDVGKLLSTESGINIKFSLSGGSISVADMSPPDRNKSSP
jgi:hypothetical protein